MTRAPDAERLRAAERPDGAPVMRQRWRDLLFLHAAVDAESIQPLLPRGLEVETRPDSSGRERAWIGLIPFRMFGVTPRGIPPLPWISAFPETNVRTYVHRGGRDPGVWFFSLDAARWLACKAARAAFSLPYFHARMGTRRDRERVEFRSERLERPFARSRVVAELGDALAPAAPDSLEHFLVERYRLYAVHRGRLATARVHHSPYPLRAARVVDLDTQLLDAAGLPAAPIAHVVFSEGVDVDVFAPRAEG